MSLDFTFNAFKKYFPACPADGTKPPRIILLATSGPSLFLACEMYELNSKPSESNSYPYLMLSYLARLLPASVDVIV